MTGGTVGTAPPARSRFGAWSAYDEQWKRKLAAILIAFAFGFLLAWFLKKCPQPGDGGGGGGGNGGGGGGGAPVSGKGAPQKLGQGAGGGASGGGGGGSGNMKVDGSGKPDGGSGDGPNSSGDSPSGKAGKDTPDPPSRLGNDDDSPGDAIIKTAEGRTSGGNVKGDTMPAGPPPPNLQMAKDFSLDSTGLPRYSSNVTGVASGISTDTVRHKKSSIASIVTKDSFDNVVSWYKGQIPAGWHASVIGDVDAMKKALSPDAIKNMISGAMSGGPVDTASVTAAQSGHGTSVAVFEPPNQTADPRGIMVMTQAGKPVQVVMTKKLQQ